MSDTTRNPDDAERGTVATGEQPGPQANGAADPPGSPAQAAGGAHPAGAPPAGASDDAAAPTAGAAGGAGGQAGRAADDGAPAPPGPGRADGGGATPTPPRGAEKVEPSGPGRPTPPRGAGQVERSGPGRPTPAPAAPAPDGRMPAPRAGGPSAAGDRGAGAPSPGPVPGPGPGAAPPPPWRRMPGREQPPPPRREATALLDDGPTAFMEPPRDTAGPTGGPSGGGGESGWSMRATRNRPPRQAALQLRRLDPWSVLKLALVLAVVLFFIWLVAVGVLYGVLGGMGVWDRLNGTYVDLVSGQTSGSPLISAGRVFAVAAVVGAINSLLFAVAVTLAAFIYNVSADLVGGVEVTLSERD